MVRVSAQVADDLTNDINTDITDNFFPEFQKKYPGLVVGKSGQQESEEEFFSEIGSLYMVALFAMYALIAIAFRSYFRPRLVMTAIPFAFMGAVYGHLFFGVTMAIFSLWNRRGRRCRRERQSGTGGLHRSVKRQGCNRNRCSD